MADLRIEQGLGNSVESVAEQLLTADLILLFVMFCDFSRCIAPVEAA